MTMELTILFTIQYHSLAYNLFHYLYTIEAVHYWNILLDQAFMSQKSQHEHTFVANTTTYSHFCRKNHNIGSLLSPKS